MPRNIYDEDHESFRSSVKEFVDRTLVPRAESMIAEHTIPREVWLEAGKQGFFGLTIPEEFGGAGIDDYRFNAVLAEELAKFNVAVSSCFGIHADITAPYIVALGTEEQKQRWLPQVATGEKILSIGMTEPNGGSDLAALKSTAVKADDGSGDWIINGSKTFITNGHQCDLAVVAIRTDPSKGAKGISLFVLEKEDEGFTKGQPLDKVGQPESDTSELFFDNVRVPADRLLGPEGMGFISMMQKLPQERLGNAVGCVAHAQQILEETIEYTKERKAFGQPIGSFQHNKFKIAELVTSLEVAQAYVDDCVAAHAEGKLSAVDAAKAKWWAAETQSKVLDECVQLHGGYGYMNEYRVARAWRDARINKIWAGTNEIMKELIGRDLGL
ncbi:acyl-CoA dehydrogenase family protein [Janibacter hoylei]|uniref:Acyl-CoA dehydrogenase n=1 Tax=Janibacter hoylei PVAS-1 TaxID=1210046 RepID=K1DZ03_9MICO|nr:acyl-CoA dehydrogenase family protein [Janibacter hoylei]EKA61619.1 acyl-CoA dehydrogenase domain-containing protein [Janibacter hoylei PVAS-1]MCT1618178.1 acyl-CoA dehydrogenase family protein [Janibacter hoylei]MCT2292709.1 acyl-CoA dehydrogenase family protein [Janibacter hoylei]MCW4600896.1 acyl-CoA dehydrogenase family protein [Janibacter hoylei]RWU85844.1 acyl-CoA dehydrogenase [Janibacter hoylei PVAS-1]